MEENKKQLPSAESIADKEYPLWKEHVKERYYHSGFIFGFEHCNSLAQEIIAEKDKEIEELKSLSMHVKNSCKNCNGTGTILSMASMGYCPVCDGRGYYYNSEKQTPASDNSG